MQKIDSFPKYSIDTNGVVQNIRTGKIRKQQTDKNGYKRVTLYDNSNKRHYLLVHRLVAIQYLEKIKGKKYINHKDGDKTNNCVDNLEWCSISENNHHKTMILKKRNGSPKKRVICVETGEIFESVLEATKKKKLNKGDISHVINRSGGHKTAGGFHWKILERRI